MLMKRIYFYYTMNKIGFQNFRRFENFQPIEYNEITFLVGRNNSGKSTLVKALLLIDDYLKSDDVTSFSFGKASLEDANIVTYGRAKNRVGTQKEDFISFFYEFGGYEITIKIIGRDDKTQADVLEFKVRDLQNGFDFIITPPIITLQSQGEKIETQNSENQELLTELLFREKNLKKDLKTTVDRTSAEYITLNSDLNTVKSKIKDLRKIIRQESISSGSFSLETDMTHSNLREIFQNAISEFLRAYEQGYRSIQQKKSPKKIFGSLKAFKDNKAKIEKSITSFLKLTNETNIVYLGATLNKQSALFAVREKENPLAQAIHDYQQLGIDEGNEAQRFVKAWMKSFEVGDSFQIKMYAGEAYEVIINDNGVETHLADKGMGSIQAMLLILRLACIIYKKAKDGQDYTIVIEEPELNLHPALQSKLADLLLEVNQPQKYGLKFIIETHSEYILRRSQVLVSKEELNVGANENPFCVYYFPIDTENELQPYRLEYQADGVFNRNFGNGFFDEASSSTLELLKLKRLKKA